MTELLAQASQISALNHFFITFIIIITMVLISRTFVAGTKYSSILIIVVFGLTMGLLLVKSGMGTAGLKEFPMVLLASKTTVIALIASFFVGGQEIKKIFFKEKLKIDDIMIPSKDEIVVGTNSTQFFFLIRAFFLLIGIKVVNDIILGATATNVLGGSYTLLAYICIVLSVIVIDNKAKIDNKQMYIRKGLIEMVVILGVLLISFQMAGAIKSLIGLPQIFFAMLISAGLGMVFSNWRFGPTLNSLLFGGIPIVLASAFLIGGSRMLEAFQITGVTSVLLYGFLGQIFWMFGGLALLIVLCKVNHIRNLAPGMAGALSHSGLTGACTAGDLGEKAASRAPIMINIPFFGHVFVFSILAASAAQGKIMLSGTIPLILVGIGIVVWSIRTLKKSDQQDDREIKGLMQFAFGWQIVAVFGSFTILNVVGMPLEYVSIAVSSALSHFGLFAAVQGGMFGDTAAGLITFIFSMPFLVHPLVFGIFGNAAENDGKMNSKAVIILAIIGFVGVVYALTTIG